MIQEHMDIKDTWKVINAKHACFDYSKFVATGAEHMYLRTCHSLIQK